MNNSITSSRLLIKNSILNSITNILTALIGFFIIPFFILHLGKETYGVWVLVGSIFRYRNILSLGINSAVNRQIPIAIARNDRNYINKIIFSSIVFYLIVSLLIFSATVILYLNLSDWFRIPSHLIKSSKILVLLIGCGFATSVPFNQYTAVLSGYQRYDIINKGLLAQLIIRTSLLIVFILNDYGLLMMGSIFVITELILRIYHFVSATRLVSTKIIYSMKYFDRSLLIDMTKYGFNTLFFTTSLLIAYKFNDLIIGVFFTTSHITQYSILTAIILLISQLLQTFLSGIKPAVSDLDERKNDKNIREIGILSQKYSLMILIPSSIFFIIFGNNFLNIWLGEEYIFLSKVLFVLILGNFAYLSQYSNFLVLVGKGHHKIFGIISLFMSIAIIILSIISLKYLKYELLGLSIATTLPMIISGFILQYYYKQKLEIHTVDFLRLIIFPSISGSFIGILFILLWKIALPLSTWLHFSIHIFFLAVFILIGNWKFGISNVEKDRFKSFLRIKR